jgi:hypothetical protein
MGAPHAAARILICREPCSPLPHASLAQDPRELRREPVMQHPVADFPQAHDVPLIAQQEQAEGQVAVIVHGRQSGKPAYLLTQPRQLRLSDVPAVEHIQRSVERSCREPPVSGVQIPMRRRDDRFDGFPLLVVDLQPAAYRDVHAHDEQSTAYW